MPTIQNQDAASPQFLYVVGGVMTLVPAWIFLAADTDALRALACVFWIFSGLPLLAFAVVRANVVRSRGETFLFVEPLPLVFGQPFSGYIETGRSLDLTKAVIKLQARRGRSSAASWESENLKRGVSAAAGGRQRLEFSGTVPNTADLWFSYPESAGWSLRFTTGLLSGILPGEFPVSVKLTQAADVASPR